MSITPGFIRGLCEKKQTQPQRGVTFDRITLVHQAALGDTVLLIPLLKSLRMQWPDARIAIVTRDEFGKLLTHLGFVDAWFSADSADHTAWFGPMDHDSANLPEWARCNLLISAVSDGNDHWANHARAAVAKTGGALHFFQPRPAQEYAGHVTQWHREQLAELSLPKPPAPALASRSDGPVLIHPGSGGIAKCWPADRFVELARRLSSRGARPQFVLGEAELDRWPRPLLATLRATFPCQECPTLVNLAELMRTARAWIGNDSGPTHLAAATGLPGIALFGPSNDVQWAPVGYIKVMRTNHGLTALGVDEVSNALTASASAFKPE